MTVIAPTPAARRAAARPAPVARTVDRRSMDGQVLGQVTLHPETFGIVPNVAVLHQVVTAQLAAARAGTQSTRTRAEVSGGGAKPFRQKGTGRARQGSTRAPQWTGGGVALGPKPRSYRQRTPKKMVRLALRSALSDRAALGKVALVDQWSFEVPRTKDAVAALTALGLDGRVLVVLGPDDWAAERSFANLPRIQVLAVGELNAYDVLRNDWVVFTDATLPGGEGAADPSSGSETRTAADGATAVAATDAAMTDGVPAGEAADEAEVADDAAASADAGADDPASAGDTAEEEQA
jgi:large subunit ribosomal protein L4